MQALHWILKRTLCTIRKTVLSTSKHIQFEHNSYFDLKTSFEGHNKIYKDVQLTLCRVGRGTYIGHGSKLHGTRIGRFCSIGREVRTAIGRHPSKGFVSTHPSFFSLKRQAGFTFTQRQLFDEEKYIDVENQTSILIGNDVWVGSHAILIDGVTIGDGAIVGAGCVVSKSIEPYAIYVGNPQKIVKKRFCDSEIEGLLQLKWWDKDFDWIKYHSKFYCDVKEFLIHVRS